MAKASLTCKIIEEFSRRRGGRCDLVVDHEADSAVHLRVCTYDVRSDINVHTCLQSFFPQRLRSYNDSSEYLNQFVHSENHFQSTGPGVHLQSHWALDPVSH